MARKERSIVAGVFFSEGLIVIGVLAILAVVFSAAIIRRADTLETDVVAETAE